MSSNRPTPEEKKRIEEELKDADRNGETVHRWSDDDTGFYQAKRRDVWEGDEPPVYESPDWTVTKHRKRGKP